MPRPASHLARAYRLAPLLLGGCVTYTARIDRDVTRGGVRVAPGAVTVTRQTQAKITLRLREVPAGVRLLGASLDPDASHLCAFEVEAKALARSRGKSGEDPLLPGESITLSFDTAGFQALASPGAALSLLLQTEQGRTTCVPIALTDGTRSPTWEPRERFTLGIDLSIEGFTDHLGAVSQIATVPFGLGVWISGTRFEVSAGYAGAGCPEERCGRPAEDQKIDYANAFVAHAGVQRPLFEQGVLSLGGGVRYRVMYLAADTFEGSESFWAHGPVLAPFVGFGEPVLEGQEGIGGARAGFVGLDIPVGYVLAGNGERSVSVGMALRMFGSFF